MLILVLAGFIIAAVAPLLHRLTGRFTGWILAVVPLAMTGYLLRQLPAISQGAVVRETYVWAPQFGVSLSFQLDGLGLLMGLLVTGIGTLIVLYGSGYLAGHHYLGRFYLLILTFMAAMLGVVLADNLIALFVFWELTSISSYLLIGFSHRSAESRQAALQALLVTVTGGLAMLAGLILIGLVGGSYEVSALIDQADALRSHALYLPILILVLLGAFTKSAQTPFHFWLPGAMAAPTPVSAYLHSATMVKAGVYLLARLSPVLGGTGAWLYIVAGVGLATALVGAFLSWQKTDLKQILAYSTIGVLGLLVALIGLGTPIAIEAAMLFLLAHALYKGALFMAAGAVDHETGTRDVERLGGLGRVMPLTAVATAAAAISMAGLPPLLGFLGKETVYEATLVAPAGAPALLAPIVTGLAVLANLFMVAAAAIVAIRPFTGERRPTPKAPHEAPPSMWLGPLTLAVLSLLFGLMPGLVDNSLVAAAATAVLQKPVTLQLKLWHGFNLVLGLSAVTVGAGLGLFFLYRQLRPWAQWLDLGRWGPRRWYTVGLDWLLRLAAWQTALIQTGYLRSYLFLVIASTVALAGMTLVRQTLTLDQFRWPVLTAVRVEEIIILLIILAGTAAAVTVQSRLAAVAALGAIGVGIALLFVIYSAPDLAMTTFAIETLTVILFMLVIYRLPPFLSYSAPRRRLGDVLISAAAGGFVTALILTVIASANMTSVARISNYFLENSARLGKGRNIVNVILVDFRSLDTLGETAVLVIAAAGVFALLKMRGRDNQET